MDATPIILFAVHVDEVFEGKTVWPGVVEVFMVLDPKAKVCYAWSHKDDDGNEHMTEVKKRQGK